MIYSRFNEPITLVSYHGEHDPNNINAPMTLVRVEYPDGERRYRFAEFLKADGGWPEIEAAFQHNDCDAKEITDAETLAAAISEAL